MINLQRKLMLKLINLSSPKFLKKAAKTSPLTFSLVNLLHRLYSVDAPAIIIWSLNKHRFRSGIVDVGPLQETPAARGQRHQLLCIVAKRHGWILFESWKWRYWCPTVALIGGKLCKWASAESIIVICVWCLQSWRYSYPQNSRITLVLVSTYSVLRK